MFQYQKNTKDSSTAQCSSRDFWREIRKLSTDFCIDTRRAVMKAVGEQDADAIKQWLSNSDYQKFVINTARSKAKTAESRKKTDAEKKKAAKAAKDKFLAMPEEKKLQIWADHLKASLPVFIFGCREFDQVKGKVNGKEVMLNRRQLKGCHLNGLVMLDFDHVENPLEIWEKLQQNETLKNRVVLAHITSSGKGIRIVFTADPKVGNIADNQIDFARQLGYNPDSSCIDACRTSFAPKEADILFINEEKLFNYYDEDFDKVFTPLYRDGKTQPMHLSFDTDPADDAASHVEAGTVASGDAEQGTEVLDSVDNKQVLKWHGFKIEDIIKARYNEKLPCAEDSNRHKESLKLATDLLIMLDSDQALVLEILEQQSWVQEIIEERDENVEQTVKSAAECILQKEKKYASSLPSKAMQDAIKSATGLTYQEIIKGQTTPSANAVTAADEIEQKLWIWGEEIEKFFDVFPTLKDMCKGLKRNQYPAALFVGGGLSMTLMTRCSYRFYHRPEELRRLNNSTLIIGDPASGKSFATRLYKLMSAPIVEADQVGIDAINSYRELVKTKGANKEKPKKPKAIIRIHPSRTSNAQLIQDMMNAVEIVDGVPMNLHMLTFDTELDNSLSLQRGGSWIDKQSLQLKAFHNEEDGQAYSNVDSMIQNFNVFWNFIYTGTPIALKKMVNENNFGSGLATRLTCIPLPSTHYEMLERESNIDLESDARLSEWAAKLDKVKGELSVQKIVDELYDWTGRRMADAFDDASKADEMLLKRCAYHGLNFAAPFIVMRHWDQLKQDGEFFCGDFETDDLDWSLAELIVNMQFACQRHFFGALADNYFDNKLKDANVNLRRNQKTIEGYNRLPEEFGVKDVMRCFSLGNEAACRTRIKRLISDNLVIKLGDQSSGKGRPSVYRKVKMMMA